MNTLPPACQPCPYGARTSTPGSHAWVGSSGDPATARLVIVGEAPGTEERWQGAPFVGASGKELDKGLGGSRDDTYITNARKCLPPEQESSANLKSSLLHCGESWLRNELAACVEARAILCVGADVLWQVVGIKNISEVVGACWNRQEVEAIRAVMRPDWLLPLPPKVHTVMACLHPAAAMRGSRWMLPTLRMVIGRAKEWSQEKYGPGWADPGYDRLYQMSINLSPTPQQLTQALEEADGPVAVDVETPRENPHHIILCGIAPTRSRALVCEWREPYTDILRQWLSDSASVACGHNFYYDHAAFVANGITVRAKVYDTITQASRLWPPVADRKQEGQEGGKKKLKVKWLGLQLSAMRAMDGVAPWKGLEQPWMQAFYSAAFGHRWAPYQYPALYCSLDVLYTRQFLEVQKGMMEGII